MSVGLQRLRDEPDALRRGAADKGEDPGPLAERCDVLIDFSTPDALSAHLDSAVSSGTAIVVGTTGLDESHLRIRTPRRHARVQTHVVSGNL